MMDIDLVASTLLEIYVIICCNSWLPLYTKTAVVEWYCIVPRCCLPMKHQWPLRCSWGQLLRCWGLRSWREKPVVCFWLDSGDGLKRVMDGESLSTYIFQLGFISHFSAVLNRVQCVRDDCSLPLCATTQGDSFIAMIHKWVYCSLEQNSPMPEGHIFFVIVWHY